MSEFKEQLHRPRRMISRAAMVAGSVLLASACTEGPLTGDPTEREHEFMEEANAVAVAPGKVAFVPKLDRGFREAYIKVHVVDQQKKTGSDRDNSVTYRPNRFKTGFQKGDGSGADSVCEDLDVPEGAKYIIAVSNSSKEAWIAFDQDGEEAHLCYPSGDNPETVAVWASNESR